MKYIIPILILVLLCLGCKKKNDDNPNNSNETQNNVFCSGSKFRTTFNDTIEPVSLIEDNNGNIIIIGNNQTNIKVAKINNSGDFLWSKKVINLPGKAGNIIALNDNSLLIASYEANNNVTTSDNAFNNIYIQNGYNNSHNCNPSFEIGASFTIDVKGKCYLSRIDTSGMLLWTKEINESYTWGNCLIKYFNNSIIFMSMALEGKQPIYKYDTFGIFQDTAFYAADKNKIKIYNIDLNGNTIWESTIDSIFNTEYLEVSPKIDMALINDKIIVKSAKEIIVLNNLGFVQNRFLINPSFCKNVINSMVGVNNKIFISGNYNTFNSATSTIENFYYTKRINNLGCEILHLNREMNLVDIRDNIFIDMQNTRLDVHFINGSIAFSLNEVNTKCAKINCNEGITYVKTSGNTLIVTRTDANGSYN